MSCNASAALRHSYSAERGLVAMVNSDSVLIICKVAAGGGRGEGVQDAAGVEAAARRYVGGAANASGSASAGASASVDDSDGDEDDCCICQEGLSDSKASDEYGEPLETGCGHRFHVVCLARHLEASTSSGQEPVCPMCRSSNLSVSFRPPTRPVG